MPLRRVDTEAPGRAQQNRFQLHMAGFAGSAPKGSSGRAVRLQLCLEPGCHSTPHPTQAGHVSQSCRHSGCPVCGSAGSVAGLFAHEEQVVMLLKLWALEPDHCTSREPLGRPG